MAFYLWSQTAATNASVDPTINFAEGQAPSSLNDSDRALMAALAKWRDDNSGALTTGGTTIAYTVASNQVFSSLTTMAGQTLRLTINATNGAAPTLNVDALGAKAIVFANGTAVGAGDLVAGTVHSFYYDNANGVWIVNGGAAGAFAATTIMLFQQTAAPLGWTKLTTHNDKALRIVSGAVSSGGTAALSTAAITIGQVNLPNYTLPNTLVVSSHDHGLSVMSLQSTNSGGGGNFSYLTTAAGGLGSRTDGSTATISGTVTSGGTGTALSLGIQYVDAIFAQKN